MSFELARLRRPEWVIGVASLILLVILFTLPWYGFGGQYAHSAAALGAHVSFSGWESLPVLRWLIVVLAVGGLIAWYLQARCEPPALPVCAVVLETALALVVSAGLVYRVLIELPNADLVQTRPAGYAGLVLALAILWAGYRSLRDDQAPEPGTSVHIETLRISPRAGGR